MAFLNSLNVKAFNCEEDNISPSVLGVERFPLLVLSLKEGTDRVEGDENVARDEETENKLLLLVTTFGGSVKRKKQEIVTKLLKVKIPQHQLYRSEHQPLIGKNNLRYN